MAAVVVEAALVERRRSRRKAARKQLGPKLLLADLMPKLLPERSRKDFPETRGNRPEAETLEGPMAQNREPGNLGRLVLKPVLHPVSMKSFSEK